MSETVSLPNFDALCAHVRKSLCERDNLDIATTPFVRTKILRRGDVWGYVFHVEGPRQLRTSAVWAAAEDRIFIYNSTGERVSEVIMSDSPPLKMAA